MTRLDSIAPKLSQAINGSERTLIKELIFQSCSFGLKNAKLADKNFGHLLDDYKHNKNLDPNQRLDIERLIAKYDEEYFKLSAEAERGETEYNVSLIPFNKARALAAILHCFNDSDIIFAAKEAIYEASATSDNSDKLFNSLFDLIKKE